MTTAALLAEARRQGLVLTPTGDGLRLRAEVEPSPVLLERLRSSRTSVREEVLRECRSSEELVASAVWCRLCWRYKREPCLPTRKRLERYEGGRWIVEAAEQ